MTKNKKVQEHMKMLIKKYGIKIDIEAFKAKEHKHLRKCEADN